MMCNLDWFWGEGLSGSWSSTYRIYEQKRAYSCMEVQKQKKNKKRGGQISRDKSKSKKKKSRSIGPTWYCFFLLNLLQRDAIGRHQFVAIGRLEAGDLLSQRGLVPPLFLRFCIPRGRCWRDVRGGAGRWAG
jgi:hypothetical protein